MSKRKFLILAVFTFLILPNCLVYSQSNYTESLTITTYYPAPYGVYRNLRLSPSQEPTAGLAPGLMYYNGTDNKIKYFNNKTWVNITDGGESGGGDTLVGASHTVSDCQAAGGNDTAGDTSLRLCKFSNLAGVTCPPGWTRYKDFTATSPATATTTYTYYGCPKSCITPGHTWSNQRPQCCAVRQCYIPKQCFSGCSAPVTADYTGCTANCWSSVSSACSHKVAFATVTEIGCY